MHDAIMLLVQAKWDGGGGRSPFWGWGCPVTEHWDGGLKNWFFFFFFFFFVKVSLRNWHFQNFKGLWTGIWAIYLGFRSANSTNFWKISLAGVKIYYLFSKWGSKEPHHAATGDLKNSRRSMKRGSWPSIYLYHLFR